jgi:hypothetical protein
MEGTSGAAERDLLRGRAREAALSGAPTVVGRRRRRRASVARQASSNRVHDGGSGGVGVSSRRSPRARDMRCPSRSGWGEASTASDLGGRCRTSRPSASRRGPWPVTSRLATGPQGPVAIRSSATPRGDPSRAKLHQRATAGAVLRGSDGRGRARGAQRLQKSTSGARPFSPTSEEHVDHDEGLASPRESAARSERASEAGSSVAKRRDRWRAPKPNKPPARAGFGEQLVDGRHPGSGQPVSLTGER